MPRRTTQSGFSAVELLITLFVAAAFLIAGYQLFNVVIKDGGETRAESKASNVAYDYLRRYSNSATNPCSAQSPLTNQTSTIDGLENVRITVSITCPQEDATSISKIDAYVMYGTDSVVQYGTFVDKSTGASPNTDITEGLIAWWPLNGNGSSAAGSYNLTNTGATPTTGQNGQPNSAYSFSGIFPNSLLYVNNFSETMVGRSAFTVTAWVRPPATPSGHSGILGFRDDTLGGVHFLQLTGSNNLECRMRVNSTTYYQPATAPVLTPNTWQLVSLVYSGTTMRCFINNTGSTAVAATWGGFTTTNLPMYIGASSYSDLQDMQNGSIDDVRIYDRALSTSEISQLVSGGAK